MRFDCMLGVMDIIIIIYNVSVVKNYVGSYLTQIMKSDVNRFRPYETGIHICQLKIEWVGKDEPVASTRIVNLDGANRYDYFEVECGVEGIYNYSTL